MLAKNLAHHFGTVWVEEYAREYIDKLNRPYNEDDILKIAEGQLHNEQELLSRADKFLFCDTELIVAKIWSEVKYGRCNSWILDKISLNPYDLYLLCDIDLPWEDDPQREHPHMRKELFQLYHDELTFRNFTFEIIRGMGDDRMNNAIKAMERHQLI